MATIKDVAALAGVSISTVSRTLSGIAPVSDETREAVMKAVEELNYQPNVLAQGLKRGRSNLISLIIPNIMNPIFPAVARGVEDRARNMGFNVILCNTDEKLDVEEDYVKKLQMRWVDGYIFATASGNSAHIRELHGQGVPVVLLIRGMDLAVDQIVLDNFKGAYEAVSYLISQGNGSVAIYNGRTDIELYQERYNGYLKALEDAGIPFDENLVLGSAQNAEQTNTYPSVMEMLEKGLRPDAIFVASDPMALGVMRAIRDFGLRVPDDISVIGFDNLEFSAMLEPPLTTVSQPLYKMGALAAERLIKRIERKGASKPPRIFRINSKLIVRHTVKAK
ncbi:MAG: LacI family transcriptional regulator [Oscillospiraceae bacterium]|jgi:DNA-binding LacI/PurR family transcriptional regulator|nr:LacI family transcriptional regulator [Oscillospiraceae bacterium]